MKRLAALSSVLLILDSVFLGSIARAQFYEAWRRRYSGNPLDIAYAVAVGASGDVYVTGESGGDYATAMYDPDGNELWTSRYNSPGDGDDVPADIAVDDQGNVYVTGTSYTSGSNSDYVTVKYAPDGTQLWVARYNVVGGLDYARAIAVDAAGNTYVTGESDDDWATIKYDPDGNQSWLRILSSGEDGAYDVAVDDSGNVYVTGEVCSFLEIDCNYVTVKYDPDGNLLWQATYNGPALGDDRPSAITVDSAGNVYVTGHSEINFANFDYVTIKYDTDGTQLWVADYDMLGGRDFPKDITVDAAGNVYVTGAGGETGGEGAPTDYATVKYDPQGNELWANRYEGPGGTSDVAWAVAVDTAGNAYVTGNIVTVQYDSSGNTSWVSRAGSVESRGMALDADGNIYVTGRSENGGTLTFSTVKYMPSPVIVDLNPLTPQVPLGGRLRYEATLTNTTSEPQTLRYAARLILPDGRWFPHYVVRPTEVVLGPYESSTRVAKQEVPVNAPLGQYEYRGYVGPDTTLIWDSDTFGFTVTEGSAAGRDAFFSNRK